MRTLLVASQGCGVGTTTTAVNLAAVTASGGARVLLLDADPGRRAVAALRLKGEPTPAPVAGPGGVWASPEGFEVATPYGDGGDLNDALESLMSHGPASYDVVVIDAPPGPGGATLALLRVADELVIVERADRESFRDLPNYLEAVRAARRGGATIGVRGILMTLPKGVTPGGPAETALRQKFKGLLPQAIPFDPAVTSARPVATAAPGTPAAKQYLALAAALKLTPVPAARRQLVAAGGGETDEDSGIFHTPRQANGEQTLSGRTETFYPDRRPRPGKGPALALPAAPPRRRTRFSPLEIAILGGSALVAIGAGVWFCLG